MTLLDGLAALPWKDRTVYIIFDSDIATKPEVQRAESELAKALTAKGANVRCVRLPSGPRGKKVGLDDYLLTHKPAQLKRFLQKAPGADLPGHTAFTAFTAYKDESRGENRPELGNAALAGLAGEIVNGIDTYSEAHPAATLAHLLVGFGVIVGEGPHCFAVADRHPCKENALIVGGTADAKGLSWGPVKQLFGMVDPRFVGKQIVSGLSTGEGLIGHLADSTNKRLLILEPEFGRPMAAMNRPDATLSTILRQLFDTGDLRVMTRGNPLMVTGTHVGIIGHITPEELLYRLGPVDYRNGFANRFLYFAVKRTKYLPQGEPPPIKMMRTLATNLQKAIQVAKRVHLVKRNPAADELWEAAYRDLVDERPGTWGGVTSRGAAHCLRLSLIYALLSRSKVITQEHLQSALAVWRYSEGSVKHVFGVLSGNALADRAFKIIVDDGSIGREQLRNRLGRNYSSPELTNALALLEKQNHIEKEVKRGKGRSTTVYAPMYAVNAVNAVSSDEPLELIPASGPSKEK